MNTINTELLILESAKKLFIINGLEKTKMQQIADEAGINKSLLHYYFRTKDKLFEAVLAGILAEIAPMLKTFFGGDTPIFTKIERFVETYINLINKNPFLPEFVFNELNRNPENLVRVMISAGVDPDAILQQIEAEIESGKIKNINPKQLLINILALTIFPFLAKPIVKRILLENDEALFNQFIEERKALVSEFIINAITIK